MFCRTVPTISLAKKSGKRSRVWTPGSRPIGSAHVDRKGRRYGVFTGTHSGPGGLCCPTGKTLNKSDYVYVMEFDGDKIWHMTKIWPDTWALKQLGWA
jgi:hypothetical protein